MYTCMRSIIQVVSAKYSRGKSKCQQADLEIHKITRGRKENYRHVGLRQPGGGGGALQLHFVRGCVAIGLEN